VAKVKTGVTDLRGKETVIPPKATKARKRYVIVIDIDVSDADLRVAVGKARNRCHLVLVCESAWFGNWDWIGLDFFSFSLS
jgi:hypothetical protein